MEFCTSSDEESETNRVVNDAPAEEDDNMFRRWSIEEDRLLYNYYKNSVAKFEITTIAAQLKRGINGTKARLKRILNKDDKVFLRLFGSPPSSLSSSSSSEGVADFGSTTSGAKLRPFSDVITKILYDPMLIQSDFTFVYEDRFEGDVHRRADESNDKVKGKERLLIKALPEHRIKQLLYKSRTVWCKESKTDLVFGSMNGCGTKLEEVIAGYEDWVLSNAEKGTHVVQLYCDLDGVLADFDAGVLRIFKKKPEEVKAKDMWPAIARQAGGASKGGFFDALPWMGNGQVLWNSIKSVSPAPIILTGCPNGNWGPAQKLSWCARELGDDVKVITCASKDKFKYCQTFLNSTTESVSGDHVSGAGDSRAVGVDGLKDATRTRVTSVLIDDRATARAPWEAAGGIFIHYHNDRVDQALEELSRYVTLNAHERDESMLLDDT